MFNLSSYFSSFGPHGCDGQPLNVADWQTDFNLSFGLQFLEGKCKVNNNTDNTNLLVGGCISVPSTSRQTGFLICHC